MRWSRARGRHVALRAGTLLEALYLTYLTECLQKLHELSIISVVQTMKGEAREMKRPA